MNNLRRAAIVGACVTALVAIAAPASAAPAITDLGVAPGDYGSEAHGVNVDGVVVGVTTGETIPARAVRWDADGVMTMLDTWGRAGSAEAINDGGTIVGYAYPDGNGPVAARWDNTGTLTVLEGGRLAYGINDHGAAVGNRWSYERNVNQPVRWTASGQVSDLVLPEPSRGADAYAINNDGIAVGEAWVGTSPDDAVRHAVRWDQDGQFTFLAPLDGSVACSAVAVNSSGEAVGSCSMPGRYIGAARWDAAGNVVDLGLLRGIESAAYDINDSGIVVGTAKDVNGTTHAVRWDTNSGCRGLGTLPGGTWAEAKSIGDDGTVVGFSQRGTEYTYRAVRWDD